METTWTDAYPSRASIRAEVETMRQAYTQTLIEHGGSSVRDLFFKGSALKTWDSLVDYVPELSDIDLHLWVHDDAKLEWGLEPCLEIQARVEHYFFEQHPQPVHVPRVQLMILTEAVIEARGFVGAPARTNRSEFGNTYPARVPSGLETREMDQQSILRDAQAPGFEGHRIIDETSKHLRRFIRDLSWRMGPLASRVLSVLGTDFDTAWGHNRTHLLGLLEARGQAALASSIKGFYVSGWQYFLSRDLNGDAGRSTLLHAREAQRLACEIASSQI
jgi:hypothetical protein